MEPFVLMREDYDEGLVFDEDEILVVVTGPRAAAATYEDIHACLQQHFPPRSATYPVYRLEEPDRWYFRANKAEADLIEGKNTGSAQRSLKFTFVRRTNEQTNFRLLWVDPRLKETKIKQVIEAVLGVTATVKRPTEARDCGRVDVTVPKMDSDALPHYIPIKREGSTETKLWFLSVLNRRQCCYFCQSTQHWPSRCNNREQRGERGERVLGQRTGGSAIVKGRSFAEAVSPKTANNNDITANKTINNTEPRFVPPKSPSRNSARKSGRAAHSGQRAKSSSGARREERSHNHTSTPVSSRDSSRGAEERPNMRRPRSPPTPTERLGGEAKKTKEVSLGVVDKKT